MKRFRPCAAFWGFVGLFATMGQAGDWPVYQHNYQRNAKTSESVVATTLSQLWTRTLDGPANPAWSGPAKWDAYAGIRGLKSMRNYDAAFHPIAVGDRVWLGSSVDDAVHCLNLSDGSTRWRFHTDGPVRIAPSFADERLYFGSDDGFAYCVSAEDGLLQWRFSPRQTDRRIANNGRLVSMWPIRTGVVVDGDRALFGASLLPWQESYLCGVDAATGEAEGPGRFVLKVDEATMEGPLAIVPGRLLVVPQGRVAPRLFSLEDGRSLGQLQGGGGSFVVLTKDSVFHGPGNKTGWLTASSLDSLETVASFKRGNAMVVAGDVSFILTDEALSATNYVTREPIWTVDCDCPFSLILSGETLFVGGQDVVRAFDSGSGRLLWSHPIDGKAFSLLVARGHLLVSTDLGQLTAFASLGDASPAPNSTLPFAVGAEGAEADPVPTDLQAVVMSADPSMNDRWVFQFPHVKGREVRNLARGLPIAAPQRLQLSGVNRHQALEIGQLHDSLSVSESLAQADLPTDQLTAVAWVRVDEPAPWGGFVGCLQDNGDYERGWLLGYQNDKFILGICGQHDEAPRLTFLAAPTAFRRRSWHHVAGVYDGRTMRLYVDGQEVAHSADQSGPIQYPPKGVYVVGAYQDENEQYLMDGMIHEIRVYRRVLSATEIEAQYRQMADEFPATGITEGSEESGARLAVGPWLEFDSPESAIVRYRTHEITPTEVRIYLDGKVVNCVLTEAGIEHAAKLNGLRHDRQYIYQVEFKQGDATVQTKGFECDTFFNFSTARRPATFRPLVSGTDRAKTSDESRWATEIVTRAGPQPGLCLCLGIEDGRLVETLIESSQLRVIAFDNDQSRVDALRERLQARGVYGLRATAHYVSSLSQIPVTSRIANVIVSESNTERPGLGVSLPEARRLLSPRGVALLGGTPAQLAALGDDVRHVGRPIEGGLGLAIAGHPIPGSADWSHIYGSAANNHYAGESLSHARSVEDLVVKWVGRPGPRFQADRNGRKPPPLATGGRLFLQGLHRILALDQFNGTVLWALEIPEIDRYNVPRDCGNWCADQSAVYLAVHDQCWQVSAVDGHVLRVIHGPPSNDDNASYDWGYLARERDLLVGSSVRKGNLWREYWGKEAWYDAESGSAADKVCSDELFALELTTSQVRWRYARGAIVNSTISVGDGTVYFVESRGEHLQAPSRRLGGAAFWQNQYLVALDAQTGRICWERPLHTQPGTSAFYSAYGDGKLVLVSSGSRQYFIYAFDGKSGRDQWDTHIAWGKGKADHGSHLSRPAIVGARLFVRPGVFELSTGKRLPGEIPVGGCGTYACTDRAMFFRAGSGKDSAMWTIENGNYTMWKRLRPDCWLSTIPAGGMLLSPEGGGGCSCGSWMETSLGFMPAAALTVDPSP